jgi:hypothetical protein
MFRKVESTRPTRLFVWLEKQNIKARVVFNYTGFFVPYTLKMGVLST